MKKRYAVKLIRRDIHNDPSCMGCVIRYQQADAIIETEADLLSVNTYSVKGLWEVMAIDLESPDTCGECGDALEGMHLLKHEGVNLCRNCWEKYNPLPPLIRERKGW